MKKTVSCLQRISVCAVLALASLFFMPDHGHGGDTGWGTCSCGHTIQGGEEACRRHLCNDHGQYCPSGGSSSGRSSSGGRRSGSGIDAGRERALQLERQKRLERERKEREAAKQRKFNAGKQAILNQMKGGIGTLGLKGRGGFKEMDFKAYYTREHKRRDVLKSLKRQVGAGKVTKKEEDWCKLHIPLYPGGAQPSQSRVAVYKTRQSLWLKRCIKADPLPVKPNQPADPVDAPGKNESPRNCQDCIIIRHRTTAGCRSEYDKDLEGLKALRCVNRANRESVKCKKELKCP